MPSKPSPTFDPFIAEIARSTASLVLSAIKPELLRPEPQPVAPAPDELLNKQAVGHNNPPDAIGDEEVHTIEAFCKRYHISRSNLDQQWQDGVGPRFFKVGTAVRITGLAGRDWVREREAAAAAEPRHLEPVVE